MTPPVPPSRDFAHRSGRRAGLLVRRAGGMIAGGAGHGLVLLALLALALNLRSPVVALPPVIEQVRADLGIGPAMAGLLTTIPVLCFGAVTPLASLLIARAGLRRAIFVTLAGVALGIALRAIDGLPAMLAGTLVIGASLTVGNIVSLLVIARDFPRRLSGVTGLYNAAINLGSMMTTALTAPLALVLGWRGATAFWLVLPALAAVLWARALRRRRAGPRQQGDGSGAGEGAAAEGRPPRAVPAAPTPPLAAWRRPMARLLALAFTAHIFIYYGLTAWLPAYMVESGGQDVTAAGLVASLFQFLALLGAFGVPVLARRLGGAGLLGLIAGAWLATLTGFLLAPGLWPLWAATGGFASGGGFTAVFVLVMRHARNLDDNRRISALVQGFGYGLASVGPLVVGALHRAPGDWAWGFGLLAAMALPIALAGLAAGRLERR